MVKHHAANVIIKTNANMQGNVKYIRNGGKPIRDDRKY